MKLFLQFPFFLGIPVNPVWYRDWVDFGGDKLHFMKSSKNPIFRGLIL